MLCIENLSVCVEQKTIITDFSLILETGTCHALMGPNGSGKSSLVYALMGHPRYHITQGTISLDGQVITDKPVEYRAREGMFLAFQYPFHMPGIKVSTFLHESYNTLTKTTISVTEFRQKLLEALQVVGLSDSMSDRYLHDGFSGGERKRLELVQLLLLPVKVALLDEIDSGLDADGIRIMAETIMILRKKRPQLIVLAISHYASFLELLGPDKVHVLTSSGLQETGDMSLALQINQQGYRVYQC